MTQINIAPDSSAPFYIDPALVIGLRVYLDGTDSRVVALQYKKNGLGADCIGKTIGHRELVQMIETAGCPMVCMESAYDDVPILQYVALSAIRYLFVSPVDGNNGKQHVLPGASGAYLFPGYEMLPNQVQELIEAVHGIQKKPMLRYAPSNNPAEVELYIDASSVAYISEDKKRNEIDIHFTDGPCPLRINVITPASSLQDEFKKGGQATHAMGMYSMPGEDCKRFICDVAQENGKLVEVKGGTSSLFLNPQDVIACNPYDGKDGIQAKFVTHWGTFVINYDNAEGRAFSVKAFFKAPPTDSGPLPNKKDKGPRGP